MAVLLMMPCAVAEITWPRPLALGTIDDVDMIVSEGGEAILGVSVLFVTSCPAVQVERAQEQATRTAIDRNPLLFIVKSSSENCSSCLDECDVIRMRMNGIVMR